MSPLEPDDFSSVENRELFLAIQAQREQPGGLTQHDLLSSLNQPLADYLRRLLAYWETCRSCRMNRLRLKRCAAS